VPIRIRLVLASDKFGEVKLTIPINEKIINLAE